MALDGDVQFIALAGFNAAADSVRQVEIRIEPEEVQVIEIVVGYHFDIECLLGCADELRCDVELEESIADIRASGIGERSMPG